MTDNLKRNYQLNIITDFKKNSSIDAYRCVKESIIRLINGLAARTDFDEALAKNEYLNKSFLGGGNIGGLTAIEFGIRICCQGSIVEDVPNTIRVDLFYTPDRSLADEFVPTTFGCDTSMKYYRENK